MNSSTKVHGSTGGERDRASGAEGAEQCRVCGTEDAGRHYGSVCCSGCKGFFRRSVRFQKLYQCPYGQQCAISKMFRNCCRFCRFQKCLLVGLDPKLVQGDWGHSNSHNKGPKTKVKREAESGGWGGGRGGRGMGKEEAELKEEPPEEAQWAEGKNIRRRGEEPEGKMAGINRGGGTSAEVALWWHDNALNGPSRSRMALGAVSHLSSPTMEEEGWQGLANYLVSVERFCDHFADSDLRDQFAPSSSSSMPNLNIPLEMAFRQPGLIAPRSSVRWTPRHLEKGGSVFAGLFSRLLVHQFDWFSHLPELSELSPHDRRILLRRRTMRSMWFTISQRSLPFADPSCPQGLSVGGEMFYPRDPALQSQLDKDIRGLLSDACNMAYDELVLPMRQFRLSQAECALIRALLIFTPVARLSPEGQQLVQRTQNKYLNALTEMVRKRCAEAEAGGDAEREAEMPTERMGRLLMLLPALEQVSCISDNAFSMFFAFNMNGIYGQLNYELHMGGTD